MSEYAIASGDHSYAVKALKLFNDIRHFLSTPGILEPKYCERVQMKGHSIIMILINVASRIRAAINDPVLDRQIGGVYSDSAPKTLCIRSLKLCLRL